tara:strand:+ start:297 stop:1004 length:708 start_codon:yes stop_codon:yes gene_type:complete
VEYIYRIRKSSLLIFFVPLIAVNICLIIVTYFGEYLAHGDALGGPTFPYFDGETSISRTARVFPSYLIFKPAMIFTGIILIRYWNANYKLIQNLDNVNNLKKHFRFYGIASAIFIILHAIFLGIKFDLDIYKFFRRFILLSFIIFELVAQTLLVINLNRIKDNIENLIKKKILKIKILLVSSLVVVAIASLPILGSSDYVNFKHALEWNYLVGILTFYLLNYFFWKPLPHTQKGV